MNLYENEILSNAIAYFREKRYILVIKEIMKMSKLPSLAKNYLVLSFVKLKDVYGMFNFLSIESIDNVNTNMSTSIFPQRNDEQKKIINQLTQIQNFCFTELNWKTKQEKLETFILKNYYIFIRLDKLSLEESRLLSNIINILGDINRVNIKNRRNAFYCYKLANRLFSNNVFSLINFATLLYDIRDYKLCSYCLQKANDLIFKDDKGKLIVYNPYNNEYCQIPDEVFKIYKKLCLLLGLNYDY